jgi:uncharacterized membrane protein YgcG
MRSALAYSRYHSAGLHAETTHARYDAHDGSGSGTDICSPQAWPRDNTRDGAHARRATPTVAAQAAAAPRLCHSYCMPAPGRPSTTVTGYVDTGFLMAAHRHLARRDGARKARRARWQRRRHRHVLPASLTSRRDARWRARKTRRTNGSSSGSSSSNSSSNSGGSGGGGGSRATN